MATPIEVDTTDNPPLLCVLVRENLCAFVIGMSVDIDSNDKLVNVFYRISTFQHDTNRVASMTEGNIFGAMQNPSQFVIIS